MIRGTRTRGRPGVTLVELLVVVAIVGMLASLLLPAVQAAREGSRRSVCRSNLRQLSLACLAHEQVRGFLPTGGWGSTWVGDPDRGFDTKQPGGWAFNLLPFIESEALHDMGSGIGDAASKADQIMTRLQTPVPLFTCPSRRAAAIWPNAKSIAYNLTATPQTVARVPPSVARGDYAACMGSGISPFHYRSGGSFAPAAVADQMSDAVWQANFGPPPDGVVFRRSRVRLKEITDGVTNTYLFGEKYIDPAAMAAGSSDDDDQSLYSGHDRDVLRVGFVPPYQDRAGFDPAQAHGSFPAPIAFGSSHPGSCGMTMVDGSVRTADYAIDPAVHRALSSRSDGR